MKKIGSKGKRLTILAFLGLVGLTSCGTANTNTGLKTIPVSLEKQGYESGFKEGYREGYNAAYTYEGKVIMENLKLWKRDILASEVGKFAVKKSIVALPKLYREGDGDRGVLESGGQEITPEAVEKLSVLSVPQPYFPNVPKMETPSPSLSKISQYPVPYKIGYLNGYKDGLKKGLRDGKKEALKEYYEALSPNTEAGKKFLKLELDKYLSFDLKVSAPRIYKKLVGVRTYYFLVPSRVEDVRTPKDVLAGEVPLPEGLREEKKTTGITLPVQGSPALLPARGEEIPSLARVRVSCKALDRVSSYGVGIEVENDNCYAVFPDKTQLGVFCKESGLCLSGHSKPSKGKSKKQGK